MQKLQVEPREWIKNNRRSELTRAREYVPDILVVFSPGLY